jgi:WD40 repeat protein
VALQSHDAHVTGCTFSDDGLKLASVGNGGLLTVWDTRTWTKLVDNVKVSARPAFGCSFLPDDNSLIATWSSDGTVKLWSSENGEFLTTIFSSPSYPVYSTSVTLKGDSDLFAFCGGVTPAGCSKDHTGGICAPSGSSQNGDLCGDKVPITVAAFDNYFKSKSS